MASTILRTALAQDLSVGTDSVSIYRLYFGDNALSKDTASALSFRSKRQLATVSSSCNLYADTIVTMRILQSNHTDEAGLEGAAADILTVASNELRSSYNNGHLSGLIQAQATPGSTFSDVEVNKALSTTPPQLHYGYTDDPSQAIGLYSAPASDQHPHKKGPNAAILGVSLFLSIVAVGSMLGMFVYYRQRSLCVRILGDTCLARRLNGINLSVV